MILRSYKIEVTWFSDRTSHKYLQNEVAAIQKL